MVYSYRVKYKFLYGNVSEKNLFSRMKIDYQIQNSFMSFFDFNPHDGNIFKLDKVENAYIYFSKTKPIFGLRDNNEKTFKIDFGKIVSLNFIMMEEIKDFFECE